MAALPQDMDDLLIELEVFNLQMRANLTQAGFEDFDALVGQDEKYAYNVCQVVRKMTGQPAAAVQVPVSTQVKLSKLVTLATYRYITRRDQLYDNVDEALMDHVFDWMEQQVQAPEDTIEKYSDGIDIRRWFESIEQYLGIKCGVKSKVPLLYVVKAVADFPDNEDEALNDTTDLDLDVARRGRLDGRFYTADNKAVWLLLKSKCHGTNMWSTISRFDRTSDGREAYKALRNQLMGRDIQSHIQSVANKTLQTLRYDGKSRNFAFTKYVSRFRQAAEDLGPDDQMSPRRMVKLFLDGFQVPSLQFLKHIIMSKPEYSDNFENCVIFISEALLEAGIEKTVNNSRTVAAVDSNLGRNSNGKRNRDGGNGGGGGRGGGGNGGTNRNKRQKKQRSGGKQKPSGADSYDPNNPTQWLKPEVFKALPEDVKKKIQDAHAAKREAKEKGKGKREARSIESSREVTAVETTVPAPAASPTQASSLRPMPAGISAVKQTVRWQKEVPEGWSIACVNGTYKLVKD